MAASLTSFTGRLNARLKLNPTQPLPRLRGSATGRLRSTGPGKPIETASYFHPPAIFLTPDTICLAVNVGPDSNFRGSRSPLTRTLTCVPPTSMTSTFIKMLVRIHNKGILDWYDLDLAVVGGLRHNLLRYCGQIVERKSSSSRCKSPLSGDPYKSTSKPL